MDERPAQPEQLAPLVGVRKDPTFLDPHPRHDPFIGRVYKFLYVRIGELILRKMAPTAVIAALMVFIQ